MTFRLLKDIHTYIKKVILIINKTFVSDKYLDESFTSSTFFILINFYERNFNFIPLN